MTHKTITLACPFCGVEPKVARTSGDERDGYALRISYVCKGCGCSRGAVGESVKGGYADNSTVELRALAAWNTRTALAEPVPPAGGEPEVIGYFYKGDHMGDQFNKAYLKHFYRKPYSEEHEYIQPEALIKLDDHRAHVTRLQAEVERERKAHSIHAATLQTDLKTALEACDAYGVQVVELRAEVEQLTALKGDPVGSFDKHMEYMKENTRLQAELTKARECIDHVMGLLRADKSTHAQQAIILYQGAPSNEFNQSAPAGKGEECVHDFRMFSGECHKCGADWIPGKEYAPADKGPLSELEVLRAAVKELEGMRDARVDAKLARGEPVAWMYRREGGECLGQLVQMESDNLKDVREGKVVEGRRILWPREDYIDWKPLYAEQPAPVAVVMPERFNVVMQYLMGIGDLDGYYFRDSHPSGRKYWWRNELRACLDELARLNQIKQ